MEFEWYKAPKKLHKKINKAKVCLEKPSIIHYWMDIRWLDSGNAVKSSGSRQTQSNPCTGIRRELSLDLRILGIWIAAPLNTYSASQLRDSVLNISLNTWSCFMRIHNCDYPSSNGPRWCGPGPMRGPVNTSGFSSQNALAFRQFLHKFGFESW